MSPPLPQGWRRCTAWGGAVTGYEPLRQLYGGQVWLWRRRTSRPPSAAKPNFAQRAASAGAVGAGAVNTVVRLVSSRPTSAGPL